MSREERITRYEEMLCRAENAARQMEEAQRACAAVQDDLKALEKYYTSPEWKEDFEADEAGLLPQGLKRGVLSEDGIDSVLEWFREFRGGSAPAEETEFEERGEDGITIRSERISAEEYIGFLKRTDLGSQYPQERFAQRIEKLVNTVSIHLTARNAEQTVVGALFGLTDFAYWLYVTDLGVDRAYEGRGIGTRLMKAAHRLAGGEKDIAVYLIANENAIPFYEKLGMKKADDVMQYNHIEWTEFTVE